MSGPPVREIADTVERMMNELGIPGSLLVQWGGHAVGRWVTRPGPGEHEVIVTINRLPEEGSGK